MRFLKLSKGKLRNSSKLRWKSKGSGNWFWNKRLNSSEPFKFVVRMVYRADWDSKMLVLKSVLSWTFIHATQLRWIKNSNLPKWFHGALSSLWGSSSCSNHSLSWEPYSTVEQGYCTPYMCNNIANNGSFDFPRTLDFVETASSWHELVRIALRLQALRKTCLPA